ncbi:hypothetical protein LMJ53_00805 [Rheinheimera sp. UJ51]|uniref:hypothetical protein n=1 Tax=Rheinheimera sp. UJ51 TaxID=2892446 RepID=UPI001E50C6F5|nr:hypothetical protein [Rheinheimera sp. UJ51]MCC5450273.1 hypothetical protein [Rheinheimera sp. UJ51]
MYLIISKSGIEVATTIDTNGLSFYIEFFYVDCFGKSTKTRSICCEKLIDAFYVPESTGHYFARVTTLSGEIKKGFYETYTVLFISKTDEQKIDEKVSSSILKSDVLPFFLSPEPQNDFLISYTSYNHSSMSALNFPDFKLVDKIEFGEKIISLFCSRSDSQKGLFHNTVFSGYAWLKNKFIYGQSQIELSDLNELNNSLGMFTCCQKKSDRFSVFSDYFGFCKLFYYQSDELSIVSNNYHSLLLFMKKSNVKIEIDFDIVRLNFSSNVTLFLQAISKRMPVKNTFMLNSWEEIEVNRTGLNIERSSFYFDQKNLLIKNKEGYKDYIFKAAEVIKNNIKLVFENKSFQKVLFDLSGGRDSRVNYAALTNIAKNYNNFFIRSNNHEEDDLKTAIAINNLYNFPYYSDGDYIEYSDFRELTKNKRSYNLGYRFLWYIPTSKKRVESAIRISGESFEAFSTRYYSNVIDNPLKDYEDDGLLSNFFKKLSKQSVLDFTKNHELLKTELTKSLGDTPDNEAIISFDNLFLYYRMATHAGNLDREFYDLSCCMPLQAKEFVFLKNYWIRRYEPDHIIYDITYSLNPLLSNIPYNSVKTNKIRGLARDCLLLNSDPISNANIKLDYCIESWDYSFKVNKLNSITIGVEPDLKQIEEFVFDEVFSYAKSILFLATENLDEFMLQVLSHAWVNRSNSTEVRIIHNKLACLYDLLTISESG